jgi:hypothetical protein
MEVLIAIKDVWWPRAINSGMESIMSIPLVQW